MPTGRRVLRFCLHLMRDLAWPRRLGGLLALKSSALRAAWFAPSVEPAAFPQVEQALADPPGLLALGGRVGAVSLLAAFESGVFVHNETYQPAKWWAPEQRMVLFPEDLHIPKEVHRLIRNGRFTISFNRAFASVLEACAEQPRKGASESWLLPLMDAYLELHDQGNAVSVEAWDQDGHLVGGSIGLVSGRLISGDSMFTRVAHASPVAIAYLCAHLRHWGYPVIDAQLPSHHLESLGGKLISRERYMTVLSEAKAMPAKPLPWQIEVKPARDGSPIPVDSTDWGTRARQPEGRSGRPAPPLGRPASKEPQGRSSG